MEINECVRTKNGILGKYIQPDLGKPYITNGISFNEGANYGKHSKDIIDLIENKDIVLVDNIKYTVINFLKNGNDDIVLKGICKDGLYLTLREVKIQSVLTHEQFEASAYVLEKER